MKTDKRDYTDFYEKFLAELLGCGYGDMEYFADLCVDFNVDIYDLTLHSEDLHLNLLINQVFTVAINNIEDELSINIDWEKISIYTNCLDSHLYINEEKMWCIDDIREHCKILDTN